MGKYDELSRSELILLHVLRDVGPGITTQALKELSGIHADCKFYAAMSGLRKKGMAQPPKEAEDKPARPTPEVPKQSANRSAVGEIMREWEKTYPGNPLQPAGAMQLYTTAGNDVDAVLSMIGRTSKKSIERPFGYIRAALAGERKKREEKSPKGVAIGEDEVYTPTEEEIATIREEVRRARASIPTPTFDL